MDRLKLKHSFSRSRIPLSQMRPLRQSRSRFSRPVVALTLALSLSLGVAACGSDDGAGNPDSRLTLEEAKRPLERAPAPLAAIRAQANQLLDGGTDAFQQRIEDLRGYPVVVNKWASWCGPCRFEFPWFQSLAERRGGEIAFLGDAGNDSEGALSTFLEELPLPYPSYLDPDLTIAEELGGPLQAFPATAFYDRSGELVYTHPGVYPDEQDLIADVERYAR
jgi:cytochrome c biogenesis protein CcmG, thiol:disulfide interchange protein DsbE